MTAGRIVKLTAEGKREVATWKADPLADAAAMDADSEHGHVRQD